MTLGPRLLCAFVFGLAVVAGAGCRTAVSTHVQPDPTACGGWKTRHLRGIPVTVSVPHHLQVSLIERRYLDKTTGKPVEVEIPAVDAAGNPLMEKIPVVDAAGNPVVGEFVTKPVVASRCQLAAVRAETAVLEKQIVFTVDAVRPAAGKLDYSAEFTDKQFFKSFNSKVDDKTIEAITNSINNIVGSLGKLPKASPKSALDTADANLTSVDHVIAVGMFDVYDGNLEAAVREFLHTHLNNCAPGCLAPACRTPVPAVVPAAAKN